MPIIVVLMIGWATIYGGKFDAPGEWEGNYMYCSSAQRALRYYDAPPPGTYPWIALDVSEYLSGRVKCNDLFYLRFGDGTVLMARALDAGYLYRADKGIVIDVPAAFSKYGVTRIVEAYNISAMRRKYEEILGIIGRERHNPEPGYFFGDPYVVHDAVRADDSATAGGRLDGRNRSTKGSMGDRWNHLWVLVRDKAELSAKKGGPRTESTHGDYGEAHEQQ